MSGIKEAKWLDTETNMGKMVTEALVFKAHDAIVLIAE